MPITALTALFVKIFIMIALGFFLKKRNIITSEFQKNLSEFLMTAVLPFSVLASANSDFSQELAEKIGQSALISIGYYSIALLLIILLARVLFRKKNEQSEDKISGIFVTMCVFANTAFLGIPIVKELYGSEGVMYAIIYNLAYQLFLFTVGIMLLSGQRKLQLKMLCTDIVTLVSILAVLLYISPFRLPVMVTSACEDIGNMCVPISMIVIGCGMADIKASDLWKDKFSYLVSFLRLLVFPLLMLVVLNFLGTSSTLAAACIVLTALPAGSLNVILAERYHHGFHFATCTVVQTMLLFMLTLPVILLCIEKWIF
ncbi:MAG: AEC family transporter [Ruthenibacterium sp.]